MKIRMLGRSGLAVSELCLGTMIFGNTTNEEDSIRMILPFVDQGGNFLDTTNVYVSGRSEEIVGTAIRDIRSEVVLATKVRMKTSDHPNGARHLSQAHHAERRRELAAAADGLYRPVPSPCLRPSDADRRDLRALDDLVTSGKVR